MPTLLPAPLPWTFEPDPSAATTPDVDTGGYDVLIGGIGFRLATDREYPYTRTTEQVTSNRTDQALEVGEQSLAALPWLKSQASFHAGAGQRYLEPTLSVDTGSRIEHLRFDHSCRVDVWTPGQVTRLPDTTKQTASSTLRGRVVVGYVDGIEYAVATKPNIGGSHTLLHYKWASAIDAAPTTTTIDVAGAVGQANALSVCTDGYNYFALIDYGGSSGGNYLAVIRGPMDNSVAPTVIYDIPTAGAQGVVAWVKARLMLGSGKSIYELNAQAGAHTALPSPKYTHPAQFWIWQAMAESPGGILAAGGPGIPVYPWRSEDGVGGGGGGGSLPAGVPTIPYTLNSVIHELTLDSAGAVPTLTGGSVVAELPTGELVASFVNTLGTFLAIGTTKGVRVATFDTYTGNIKLGPLSFETTNPQAQIAARDRFIYGAQEQTGFDGVTRMGDNGNYSALARLDLTMPVDQAGRLAWASDLRPAVAETDGFGEIYALAVTPYTQRVVIFGSTGVFVEGSEPGDDGDAFVRTSRIRYSTSEPKLFKAGRVRGAFTSTQMQVYGITPFLGTFNLGTFGPLTDTDDPGEFRLPTGLHEWIQLQINLIGAESQLNSYQVKAIPAPKRQRIFTLTVWCMGNETDKHGLTAYEPLTPRQRLRALQELESEGNEIRYVEFTNQSPDVSLVVIEQLQFIATSRPKSEDDFGGKVTLRLRTTEGF